MINLRCSISLCIVLAAIFSTTVFVIVLPGNAQAATVTGGTQPPPNTPITPKAGAGAILPVPTRTAPLKPYYNAPTENLTKVANAIALQTYSLTTQVIFSRGLALTKPVCITVFYDSYSGRAYSNALLGTYDGTNGNQFVFNDQEGLGTPRPATLRIQLFEPGSGGCAGRVEGAGFNLPEMRVNLDPIYYVRIQPFRLTRLNACPWGSSNVQIRWFSPDDQFHETSFHLGAENTYTVAESEWTALEVSASRNYHIPAVGIYGLSAGPSAASNVNLIPAPLGTTGTPVPSQQITLTMRGGIGPCDAMVQYTIDRQLRRSPPLPTANVTPLTGGAFEQPK